MSVDLSQFHQVFIEESFEGLEQMENALMHLDVEVMDSELINAIFRCAHSIKGGGATLGFTAIAEFTHVLETLLDQVRSKKRALHPSDVNLFLQSVDCMREMLKDLQNQKNRTTPNSEQLKIKFQAILNDHELPKAVAVALEVSSEITSPALPMGENAWQIYFKPGREILKTGNDPIRLIQALEELGSLSVAVELECLPSLDEYDPESLYFAWRFNLQSTCDSAAIKEVFDWVIDVSQLDINLINKSVATDEVKEPAKIMSLETSAAPKNEFASDKLDNSAGTRSTSTQAETSTIRVGIDKIDSLINMVGELIITQSMLGQLGTEFNENKIPKLLEGLSQLEQNTRELQESVMRIRMLPISFVFSRFPRMVRDLSQQVGKKIRLEMTGDQTELDKTVMEKIGDPLVHLVRNAIDHGIESPQERLANGKSETGLVTLEAYHQGGHVVIEIVDDGRGLDGDKIVKKAIEKGLITDIEAANMSESQIYELIFQPGFSTAQQVSELSGRGVGMDVVKKNIQALNGVVELSSKKGFGSKINIRLPLTLAILDGQLVRVGSNIYVFPLVSIVESMRCKAENINYIAGGCRVFKLRDEYVPIVELSEAFNTPSSYQHLNQALMVVVEAEDRKVAVVVDELLGQQQVVIKSLEQNYRRVDGVSGATILGDGTVALIIDVPGVVSLAGETQLLATPTTSIMPLWRKRA